MGLVEGDLFQSPLFLTSLEGIVMLRTDKRLLRAAIIAASVLEDFAVTGVRWQNALGGVIIRLVVVIILQYVMVALVLIINGNIEVKPR